MKIAMGTNALGLLLHKKWFLGPDPFSAKLENLQKLQDQRNLYVPSSFIIPSGSVPVTVKWQNLSLKNIQGRSCYAETTGVQIK